MTYLYLFGNILLLVAGQLLFKVGLNRVGTLTLERFWSVVLSPYIIAGLALYLIATVLWFMVLSRLQLSVAYPLQSLAYVLAVLAGAMLFQEQVSPARWVGVAVILGGVVLVARS